VVDRLDESGDDRPRSERMTEEIELGALLQALPRRSISQIVFVRITENCLVVLSLAITYE
jgi:hypothetical protein